MSAALFWAGMIMIILVFLATGPLLWGFYHYGKPGAGDSSKPTEIVIPAWLWGVAALYFLIFLIAIILLGVHYAYLPSVSVSSTGNVEIKTMTP